MLVYTSGTTATPKGVLITHRNYLISTAPAWSQGLQTGPDDTWLFVMPFHTIAGLGSMTTLTLLGATLVLPATRRPRATLPILAPGARHRPRPDAHVLPRTGRATRVRTGAVGAVRRCMTYGAGGPAIEAWSAAAPDARWGTYWGQSELSQLGTVGWFAPLATSPAATPRGSASREPPGGARRRRGRRRRRAGRADLPVAVGDARLPPRPGAHSGRPRDGLAAHGRHRAGRRARATCSSTTGATT